MNHKELLANFTTPLTDLAPKPLPDDNDFAELDAMLAKATYVSPQTKNKANLKAFQDKLSDPECRAQKFKLVQGIIVWQELECNCGYKTPLLFQRFMEKWQLGNSINWKTVQEFDRELEERKIENTVIKRKVCFCKKCTPVFGVVKNFNEVVKGEKEG